MKDNFDWDGYLEKSKKIEKGNYFENSDLCFQIIKTKYKKDADELFSHQIDNLKRTLISQFSYNRKAFNNTIIILEYYEWQEFLYYMLKFMLTGIKFNIFKVNDKISDCNIRIIKPTFDNLSLYCGNENDLSKWNIEFREERANYFKSTGKFNILNIALELNNPDLIKECLQYTKEIEDLTYTIPLRGYGCGNTYDFYFYKVIELNHQKLLDSFYNIELRKEEAKKQKFSHESNTSSGIFNILTGKEVRPRSDGTFYIDDFR